MPQTSLVTLALDPASQAHFEDLRRKHYPAALNRIPAHVSLFHTLPYAGEIEEALRDTAAGLGPFCVKVTGLRSLGRGVAYTLSSPELMRVHRELACRFTPHLTPQDRRRFTPHVVVQNKVTSEQARELLALLQASFEPLDVQATGLLWWEYLGGPWRLIRSMSFPG